MNIVKPCKCQKCYWSLKDYAFDVTLILTAAAATVANNDEESQKEMQDPQKPLTQCLDSQGAEKAPLHFKTPEWISPERS